MDPYAGQSPIPRTPIRLRALLLRHRISSRDAFDGLRIERKGGQARPVSDAMMSLLLCHNQWPAKLNPEHIKTSVEAVLLQRGVPFADIKTAWDIETEADAQAAPSNSTQTAQLSQGSAARGPQLPETEMLSPHAKEHFGLPRDPFLDDVQGPDDVFLSKNQRYVRDSMIYAAKHGGFVAVVGESGAGKSTLRRDVLEKFRTQADPIVAIQPQCIDKTVLSAAHICDAIVADLSMERPRQSLEAKARRVRAILRDSSHAGNRHVLVIEEAHDLRIETIKYLKRFWEVEDGYRKLLGIILIGQPELADKLDERKNWDAREVIRRIEIARLKPLDAQLEEYLALKFKRVGQDIDEIVDRDAYDAIRLRLTFTRSQRAAPESHIYPLIVHRILVAAMNQAPELGLQRVSAELIRRV